MPPLRVSLAPSVGSPIAGWAKLSTIVAILTGKADVHDVGEKTRRLRADPGNPELKRALPTLHVGGRFTVGAMARTDTVEHENPLATIDIDHRADGSEIPLSEIPALWTRLRSDRHLCLLAPSARGWLWGIIVLRGTRKAAYATARQYFRDTYQLDIGAQGDLRRARYLAVARDPRLVVHRPWQRCEPFVAADRASDHHADRGDAAAVGGDADPSLADMDADQLAHVLSYVDPFCGMVEWVRLLGGIKAQLGDDGRELACNWSRGALLRRGVERGTHRFEQSRFDSAWDSLRRSGGVTARTIILAAQANGYNPRQEAYSAAAKQEIGAGRSGEWVATLNGSLTFTHLPTRAILSRDTFDAGMAKHFLGEKAKRKGMTRGIVNPSQLYLNVLDIPRVAGETYAPGQPPLVEEKGRLLHNLWRESGEPPIAEAEWTPTHMTDIDIINGHMRWLLGPDNASILLDYLAMVVQRREHVRWCPIIVGPEGCGKTIIGELMAEMLGDQNCGVIHGDQLGPGSPFNDWAAGKEFVALEEIRAAEYSKTREVLERLKPLITNPVVSWNRKGKPVVTIPNTVHYFASTNFSDALQLWEGDRRWCVLHSEFGTRADFIVDLGGLLQSESYFRRLAEAIHRSPGAIRGWLLSRRCRATHAAAPLTEDKLEMVEANKSALDLCIDACLARLLQDNSRINHNGKPAIVAMPEIRGALTLAEGDAGLDTVPSVVIARRLRERGYVSLGNGLRFCGKNGMTIYAQRGFRVRGEEPMYTVHRATVRKKIQPEMPRVL